MQLKDIIKRERGAFVIHYNDTISDAIGSMLKNRISCLPVLDENEKLIGILSERDIIKEINANSNNIMSRFVADSMTRDLLIAVMDDELEYVMNIMTRNNIRHMPIMDGDGLIGMISVRDVIKGLMHEESVSNRFLSDYSKG